MALTNTLYLGTVPGDTAVSYDARLFRQLTEALVWSQGIVRPGDFAVTQRSEGANFSVDIAAGIAFVQGDSATRQGKYLQENDGKVNVPTPSPPGSGTRQHVLYLQVNDKQAGGGSTTYTPVFGIAQDTGSGPPTVPSGTIPRAIPLARISIATGQSSILNTNIVDLRPRATIMGYNVTAQDRVFSGTTDKSGYVNLPHSLGRKPTGCLATYSHPAPASGGQPTSVTVDLSSTLTTTTQLHARVWWPQPFFVWPSKPVTISYRVW